MAEAVAHAAHGLDQVLVFLAELGAQAADVHVYRAGPAVILVTPHSAQQHLAREHSARILGEELQQLVFHVGEVERLALDCCLVGLDIERKPAVLNEVGPQFGASAAGVFAQHEPQASFELDGVKGSEAEVVEQVVAHAEIGELASAEQHQQWRDGYLALAERAAQCPRSFGVSIAGDHRAGPAAGRFVASDIVGASNGFPLVTAEVERAHEIGGRWVTEDGQ